jgi:hypothetical protein
MDPGSAVQPYSVIFFTSRTRALFVLRMMCAFSFLYLDCIMRWIDLFMESGTVSHASCIMQWIDLLDIVLDGF